MEKKINKIKTLELEERIKSIQFYKQKINHAKFASLEDYLSVDIKSINDLFNSRYLVDKLEPLGTTSFAIEQSLIRSIPNFSFKRGVSYKYRQKRRKLEELSIDELMSMISQYSVDQYEYVKIQSLIIKKRFALWLEGIIKKLKRILKFLLNKYRVENKRDNFRKINCFFFKNLDDTHSVIAFN